MPGGRVGRGGASYAPEGRGGEQVRRSYVNSHHPGVRGQAAPAHVATASGEGSFSGGEESVAGSYFSKGE